jgi:CBS domain-containing protein
MTALGTIGAVLAKKGGRVYSISPGATVYEAIEKMAEHNVGALLVMEGEQLVGIISERDYTRKVALFGKHSKDTLVKEISSEPRVTVTPESTVEDAMWLMTNHRVRHLPVIENGKVIGVVSIGDLVNWIIQSQAHVISQLTQYIQGQY